MKYITLSLLLFISCKEISAQDIKPEEVKGKVIGFGPNGGFLKEKQFIIGHNVGINADENAHSDFSFFDQNLRGILNAVLLIPSLNPPTGFNAAIQLESYHPSSKKNYSGLIHIWLFAYIQDWATKKNVIDEETSFGVKIYVNDPSVLMGERTFFSDTLKNFQQADDDHATATNYESKEINIIQKNNKALFVPYTKAQFLLSQQKYYQQQVAQWTNDLNDANAKLDKASNPSAGNAELFKGLDDRMHEDSTNLVDYRTNLKTAEGAEKQLIQQQIQSAEADIAATKKAKANSVKQSTSTEQSNTDKQVADTYATMVETTKQSLDLQKQKLAAVTQQYNAMSAEEKLQQAFVIDDLNMPLIDEVSMPHLTLASSNDENAKRLYTYDPNYFNKDQNAGNIQLLVITYAQSVISSDYGSQKQLEIIHQLDYKALHALLKTN